ncbi:hypothetical protein TNCV_4689131 [Trichonephila clavipes]|nr:hypothetical protein TNCV_4689131 [Trichonephila clavipes]
MIVGSIGTTNHHATWGYKPRLVSENRDNSISRGNDDPDEEKGETNAGIYMSQENDEIKNLIKSLREKIT